MGHQAQSRPELITWEAARQVVLGAARALPQELVDLVDADGRVLARDVVAGENLPAFANSAMDGFAVRAADLADGPKQLPLVGAVRAGDSPMSLPAGHATSISTGAPLPSGADAIVPIEDATWTSESVDLPGPVRQWRFVRAAGSDVARGETALRAGMRVGAAEGGLLAKTEPNTMANFKNVRPEFVGVYWDEGRHYSVPWQYGKTTFVVNTDKYKGDIDTLKILFDPPAELKGRINVLDDINSLIHAAERYAGVPRCGGDKEALKKVNDVLVAAKPSWRTFSYDTITKLTSGDVDVTQTWNGAAYRMRQKIPAAKFSYPKEGIEGWMDNASVLKDAKNMENAKLFQNFIMDPENAALISEFAGYDNGITGSLKFLTKEFAESPELNAPAGAPVPEFVPPCSKEVVEMYNKIWTNLKK